jgi:hypothetical protein
MQTTNDYIVMTALDTANNALANSLGDPRVKYWHRRLVELIGEYVRVSANHGTPVYGGTVRGDVKRRDVVSPAYALASNIRVYSRYCAGRAPIPAAHLADMLTD